VFSLYLRVDEDVYLKLGGYVGRRASSPVVIYILRAYNNLTPAPVCP
jgi:hypothetical protein